LIDDGVRRRALAAERRERLLKISLGLLVPIAALSLWELLVRIGVVDRRFFPPPSKVFVTGVTLLATPRERAVLGADVLASAQRLVIGYGLGSFLGIVTGIAMGLSKPLRFGFGPSLNALYSIPKLAIFPLTIVIFGLGDASKIALITIGVFFMTFMSTISGVLHIPAIHRDVAKAFALPPATRWFRIVIPGALPAIVTGLKLGLGQALVVVVSTEMISGEDGLGHFIWESWQILDIPRMFMGLVVVGLAGGGALLFGEILERYLTPWASR
jgi:NitT/TauT family transport system permease protein